MGGQPEAALRRIREGMDAFSDEMANHDKHDNELDRIEAAEKLRLQWSHLSLDRATAAPRDWTALGCSRWLESGVKWRGRGATRSGG
ncbi:hypothetical protein BDW67DRAFT_163997 [Aspergillus spinulosporus]